MLDGFLQRLIDQVDVLRSVEFVVQPARRSGRALVASSVLQRARGLRGIELGEHAGMLFDPGGVDGAAFTMSGMTAPLEIVWLDALGEVVGGTTMPAGARAVMAPGPYRWAFECPPGGRERLGLDVGARMLFEL